jgi:hypothetical protein
LLIDFILITVGGFGYRKANAVGADFVGNSIPVAINQSKQEQEQYAPPQQMQYAQPQQPYAPQQQQQYSPRQQQFSPPQQQYPPPQGPSASRVLSLESLAVELDIPSLMNVKDLETALAMPFKELKENHGVSNDEYMRLKKYKAGL